MKQWMISFTLFMAVFVGCIATIFNPPKTVVEVPDYSTGQEAVWKVPDQIGLAKTWTENPNYFITVGITLAFSVVGAWWSIHNLTKLEKENEKEPDTSKGEQV